MGQSSTKPSESSDETSDNPLTSLMGYLNYLRGNVAAVQQKLKEKLEESDTESIESVEVESAPSGSDEESQ